MVGDLESGIGEVNGHRDQPLPGANQPSSSEPNLRDGSEQLFSMYLEFRVVEDNKMVERWKEDANVFLIYTGLFSAAVAALLTVTVLDLKSDSTPFSPPISAVWVNALLFLSLVISITCALLATSLHQAARRYVRYTQQPRYSPTERARTRAFFSDGVDKLYASWVVEALPTLLHLSLCLFFAGLLVWLFNLDHPVFRAVVVWAILSAVAYIWITFLPIFRPNSPFYAPLSPTIWFLYTGIPYVILKVRSSVFGSSHRFDKLKIKYHNRLLDGIGKTAEKIAWELSPEIDVRILGSTLDSLREDRARAKFFAAIPGFFNSKQVKHLREDLLKEFQSKFKPVLDGFLDHTFSSTLASESFRSSQLIICLNATHAVLGRDGVLQILCDIFNERWPELLQSVEMAHTLRRWSNGADDEISHYVRRIVTRVVAGVRERDDRWISLAMAEFNVPDHVLAVGHGDSALFSLFIYITRQAFRTGSWTPFILSSLTTFDIRNTLPELQHDFCALWNEIVHEAWTGGTDSTAINILREIRHAYIGLHQGTDAAPTAFSPFTNHFNPVLEQPLSYRFCNIANHRQDWIPEDPVANHLAVPPTRADLGSSAASTTQVGDSPNHSPRPPPLEIPRFPGNADIFIIPEEANIISRFPSSPNSAIKQSDQTPSRTHAFFSTPRSVYIALPVTDPSIPESIGAIKAYEGTRDLNLRISTGITQHASQSAPSVADTDANIARPEDPAPVSSNMVTRETSQAPVAASFPCPHPGPLSTILDPSTGPVSSSCISITYSGHDLDVTTLRRPPESNTEQDIASPSVESDSEISLMANPIPQTVPSSGAILQKGEGMTVVPATVVSDSQSSSIPMPVFRSCVVPADSDLPSTVKSTGIQSGHIPHPLGSPSSSSSTTPSHISPRPSSDLDTPVQPSNAVLRAHGRTSNMEPPIPLADLSQLVLPSLNIVVSPPQPDHPHG